MDLKTGWRLEALLKQVYALENHMLVMSLLTENSTCAVKAISSNTDLFHFVQVNTILFTPTYRLKTAIMVNYMFYLFMDEIYFTVHFNTLLSLYNCDRFLYIANVIK